MIAYPCSGERKKGRKSIVCALFIKLSSRHISLNLLASSTVKLSMQFYMFKSSERIDNENSILSKPKDKEWSEVCNGNINHKADFILLEHCANNYVSSKV